jgi:beta-galactosidase
MRNRIGHLSGQLALLWLLLVFAVTATQAFAAAIVVPSSNRHDINLGETPWRYAKDTDNPSLYSSQTFDDSGWAFKGVPQSPSDDDTFINEQSGGGEGELTGNITWYRKHFKIDSSFQNRKVLIEFQGAHVGAQVYINGNLIHGNSAINPNATHVMGFIPFIVDATQYLDFNGGDNVIAVKTARNDAFFQAPSFGGAFRFGQSDSGLFRPVIMHITDRTHIPENVYSVLQTWGTYVATTAASPSSATVQVQTNVLNENTTDESVTLTTQIVDANGQVVKQDTLVQTVPASTGPGLNPVTFTQNMTISNPTLWYPAGDAMGGPYLYHVIHTISVNGTVVDSKVTPLGIRTLSWDHNFPIFNGHARHLWGASGRYDFPALGSAVPAELQWRDLSLLAQVGGSVYRPGHSAQGPDWLDGADAYGVMMIQPSGDGEGGFGSLCPTEDATGCLTTPNNVTLKKELHRDMVIHDRNHPSVLGWEANNGGMVTSLAQELAAIAAQWEPINTRVQIDRTPDPANGGLLGCSGDGCDFGVKQKYPDTPSFGSENWGDGVGRAKYDFELAFAAPYLKSWVQSVQIQSVGMAHWYLADTPGEIVDQVDGTLNSDVRGNGASMMDANRLPRLIYYMYEALWMPFELKPVVKLAHTWNRSGDVTVNAFSNCPQVALLLNGQPVGAPQVPNPSSSDPSNDLSQNTTLLPGQVHWDKVQWQPGTLVAQCLNDHEEVVTQDQLVTAGAADHIVLTAEPQLVKPDGTPFVLKANGSDAEIIHAAVVDANGVVVPDASQEITFAVSGAAGEYRGGSDHYVSNGQPLHYHSPGDTRLFAEGGLTQVVVRSTFTPGTVTVTASAPGLGSGTTSYDVEPTGSPDTFDGKDLMIGAPQAAGLQIITQPASTTETVGLNATFTVLAASSTPLTFQWMRNNTPIQGATNFGYTTPPLQAGDDQSAYTVRVSNGSDSKISDAATLTVVQPKAPTIKSQPRSQAVTVGLSAEFDVIADGSPDLSYQWLRNNAAISGANRPTYVTPATVTADNNAQFSVVVKNSAGQITSSSALLTVAQGTFPSILIPPRSQSVTLGQNVTLTVSASGSDPLAYQWKRDDVAVGTNSPNLTIASATDTDNGAYTVTVSNSAGSVTSGAATVTVSGGGATNLALGATATSSSVENDTLAPKYAIDGNLLSRWGSTPGLEKQWIQIDLGVVRTFNQISLAWERAYADQYEIQVSNDTGDNKPWTTLYTQMNGAGGTETIVLPSTSARFVRMFALHRGTGNGVSLNEFGIYDVPQCDAQSSTERFTPVPRQAGTYVPPSDLANPPQGGPGLPQGPFVPTVHDNVSGLTWQQYSTTFPGQGSQFVQSNADEYCKSVGMRLPTQPEAMTVARANFASCAFPLQWTTWTTTNISNLPGDAYIVNSQGNLINGIKDNTPGASLCVSGPSLAAPVIIAQPANQSAAEGTSAQFTVGIDPKSVGPFSYQWFENNKPVAITTIPSFVTAPTVAATDNNASISVTVSNGGGSVSSANATLTVTAGGNGGNGNGGNGGNTNPTGTAGNGGNPPVPSANLALGKQATASGVENDGDAPQQAVDGNDGTRWSSAFADPQWIKIDLGSDQTFDRVVLRWQDSFAVDYQIQTSESGSDDDSAWTPVYTETGGKGGTEDVHFKATTARFVRMHGTKRATQFGYSLFEFGVYNTANTPQFAIAATSTGSGTVSPAGTTQVYQGGPVTYTFTPADGFAVTDVQIDGQDVGLVSSYTFDDVLQAHTVNVTFGPSSGAVNLALGSQATSSGLESDAYPASAAVDGNMNTRWSSSFNDPSWILLDLGTSRPFNRVMLFWQDAASAQYVIEVSNGNNQWTTVATQNDGKGGVEDILFATVTARYIRLTSTKRTGGYGNSLYEFQVYNTPGTGDTGGGTGTGTTGTGNTSGDTGTGSTGTGSTGGNTGTGNTGTGNTGAGDTGNTGSNNSTNPAQAANGNLALGKQTKASGTQDDGYPASAAVDGDLNSRWSSEFNNDSAWIDVDLGQAQLFDRVVLRWENAYGKSYLLQASNDEKTWTTIYTQSAGKGGAEDISVPATTARYLRMQGQQRSGGYGYSLFELEVYNTATTPKFAITASGDANGTLSPAGTVNVESGAAQTFTAVPAKGYGVGAMFVDGKEIGVQSTYSFSNVRVAHTINAEFVPQAASINLALHKAASASSLENNGLAASAAVDGDPTTRFSSAASAAPQWLEVDLGTAQTFDRAVIEWQDAYAVVYDIQTSMDEKTWTTVFSQNAGQGGLEDLKLAASTARYARIYMTQRKTQYGDSIYEFQLYNSGATASAPVSAFIEQPAGQTVPVGQNGHFAVLPTGNGPFTYQWRRNGTPIANATSRTFDTPVVAAGDSGTVYSVIVTGPNGSATSNDATLTVDTSFPTYTVKPGFVTADLANNTNGAYTDDQVYVLVLGRDAANQFSWVKPDGTVTRMALSDNDAQNHLTGPDGQNYANYAFTLAQSKTLVLPKLSSGRIYVSLGKPVYLKVLNDANNEVSFAGPNPQNQTDANLNVRFDWYEFTYGDNGLWINTTQVDEFGFPLTEDVYGSNRTFHKRNGITQRGSDLYAAYANEVSAAFQQQPPSPLRIMSPGKSTFAVGQPNAHYFDAYVDAVWQYYTQNSLVLNMFNNSRQFVGKVQGDQLVFNEVNLNNGAFVGGTYVVNKPTTQDVLQGTGALNNGNSTELAIEVQICAAFNRHVMEDVTKWADPQAWYAASPSNEYARFFHDHSISGLAYGFPYDDASDASTLIMAPQPEHVTFGIGQ